MPRQQIERLTDLGALSDRKHAGEKPEGVLRALRHPMKPARGTVDQILQMPFSGKTDNLARYYLPVDNVTRPSRGRVT